MGGAAHGSRPGLLTRWRAAARRLKTQLTILALAARHPATPWPARLLIVVVVAYALSPIDLIPDFIPVIGLLDDLVLVPLGLWLAMRLVPAAVWAECTARATAAARPPASRGAAFAIVVLWGLGLVLAT
ncbi:MAG: YkvA family protein, partial [Piscinibacter sp.]|uniref:YkvA family protein n=1 Tax=Piscinibacter sp. TaxID=1903157 RepID=UPI003D125189